MEISQGNSLCSYLYLKLKCNVFHFVFSLFSPTNLENRKAEQVLPGEGWQLWEGEVLGKVSRRMNTVPKCVHMQENAKMIPVKSTP
jgi:hypothetical protein